MKLVSKSSIPLNLNIVKKPPVRIGPPRLTRYEKARIIAARALQLSLGAMPLIDISSLPKDPVEIAKEELRRGVLPITLVRYKPSGEKELVPVNVLLELEKKIFGRIQL